MIWVEFLYWSWKARLKSKNYSWCWPTQSQFLRYARYVGGWNHGLTLPTDVCVGDIAIMLSSAIVDVRSSEFQRRLRIRKGTGQWETLPIDHAHVRLKFIGQRSCSDQFDMPRKDSPITYSIKSKSENKHDTLFGRLNHPTKLKTV